MGVCMCVCVQCVRVYVCERERERKYVSYMKNLVFFLNTFVYTHTHRFWVWIPGLVTQVHVHTDIHTFAQACPCSASMHTQIYTHIQKKFTQACPCAACP